VLALSYPPSTVSSVLSCLFLHFRMQSIISKEFKENIQRQKTWEQLTIKPNLVGCSRHIPQVVSWPLEVSAEVAEDSAEEVDKPISVAGFEDVSCEAISCRNQQSFPLLHLENISMAS
jgi:hypothetical protein